MSTTTDSQQVARRRGQHGEQQEVAARTVEVVKFFTPEVAVEMPTIATDHESKPELAILKHALV
jgi:hypothetical protein